MKSSVKSVVVLSAICVVIAVILAFTNKITLPVIEANKASAETEALAVVMPDNDGFEEVALTDTSTAVQKLYKEKSGKGYVAVLSTKSQYSQDNMGIIVAIGTDGTITGVTITGYYETKDFGKDTYPLTYIGADSALNGVDTYAGVTYSSTAFKNAILDAFNVLIASGAISEGQKSDEQLVKEMIPTVLPGCVNAGGTAQVTETEVTGFDMAYAADNGCGYVLVEKAADGTLVYAVNAFGDVKCYDLEGNEQESTKTVSVTCTATENMEKNLSRAKNMFDTDVEITAIESVPAFGCITGAFLVNDGTDTYYVFNAKSFGFQDLMEMTIVVDAEGKIAKYKTNTDLIQEEQYYTSHQLKDKTAYISQFVGLTEETYSDDITVVTGATITAGAVANTLRSAFAAYRAIIQ